MGYYINNLPDGPLAALRKAEQLLKRVKDSYVIARPKSVADFQEDMVCVAENGFFDAAGYAFSPEEMMEFVEGAGGRKTHWLIVPGAKELAK